MFEKIKENVNNYIENVVNNVIAKDKAINETNYTNYKLPEPNRNELLALSIQKTHKDLKPITPEGIAMDAAPAVTSDKFISAYNVSNPASDIIFTFFATQGFIGFQACAILCQNWLINKACCQPPKDAIRPPYDLSYITTNDNEEIDNNFIAEIINISNNPKKFNIKKVCKTFAEKKRQFGQVLAYPIIEGANYEEPFNIDGLQPNSYKGMTIIDPIWYEGVLDSESISDPTSLRYFEPTYFLLPDGKKIHYSWCIFGTNGEISDDLKPTYRWGGYPIPQLIYERVYSAEKTANEAHMLAMSKRLLIADINVKAYLSNPTETAKELEALTQMRDNFGVAIKRPGDSISQIDTSLADFDAVIMTQYQLVAAAANMPATKLLETQPKGFNSSGDYEDKQYKLTLVEIQNNDFIPLLDFHFALLCKSKYGINRDFTITFKEIDTPTELERAQINSTKAQTDSTYISSGVLSPDEIRSNLIKDPNSGYNDIEGELPEDEADIDFSDEENGGSSNEQDSFKGMI